MLKKILVVLMVMGISGISMAKDIRVTVNGMVCGFCAQGITKKFKAREEIESVDVSLEKKTVTLKTKIHQDLTDKVITDILTESGYSTEKIDR